LRYHLTSALAATRVGELTELGLSDWHDGLAEKLAPATVNRTATCLKAALNLAARLDPRLRQNSSAWKIPLAAIPDAEESRNVILVDDTVCHLVIEAPAIGPAFALLVEVAALSTRSGGGHDLCPASFEHCSPAHPCSADSGRRRQSRHVSSGDREHL